MSVNSVAQALQNALARLDQTLFIKSDPDFVKSLNVGQVLKGKVLRHYEGSRYLVSFNGQEKVVDSAVPLKTGELLYGRVVGLGEQVKLQRLVTDKIDLGTSLPGSAKVFGNYPTLNGNERLLLELYTVYQETLTDTERATIVNQMSKSSNANLMAMSSLILSKLGIMQAPEFLKGVFRNLQGEQYTDKQNLRLIPKVARHSGTPTDSDLNAVQQLGDVLFANYHGIAQKNFGVPPDTDAQDPELFDGANEDPQSGMLPQNQFNMDGGGKRDQAYQEWLLGRWILNMQNEGSVSHSLSTFPIWFGDRLVEVSVAVFDQRKHEQPEQLRHKKLVFSISTEYLGKIELTVLATGQHMTVDVIADNEHTAIYMAGYLTELKQTLTQAGWTVDAINYGALGSDREDGVLHAIVEHHVSQNSLNQLI